MPLRRNTFTDWSAELLQDRIFTRWLQKQLPSFLTLALGSHRWGVNAMSRKASSAQRKDRVVNGDAGEKGKLVCFVRHNSLVLLTSFIFSCRGSVSQLPHHQSDQPDYTIQSQPKMLSSHMRGMHRPALRCRESEVPC